jgi:endonuclease/exonuclease/phosphatase family metal-dependent hydrolase
LVLVAAAAALAVRACPPPGARIATFNIEDYPKSQRQVEKAFDQLAALRAEAIAVQEITDPDGFEAEARRRLGPTWRFLHDRGLNDHHVGVLYDAEALPFLSTRVYRETEVGGLGKPTLEVRLKRGGGVLRLMVVHLKAGGDGVPTRLLQLRAIQPVLDQAVASKEQVVLLGDFNSTSLVDRTAIAALAAATSSSWESADLGCTSLWRLPDECRGSALDHVLATEKVTVTAAGPCARSCDFGRSCPVYRDEVSDHCPLIIELP